MTTKGYYDQWNGDTEIRSILNNVLGRGMVMTDHDGRVYRYDYWKKIPDSVLGRFPYLKEHTWFEEDCGRLYCYHNERVKIDGE